MQITETRKMYLLSIFAIYSGYKFGVIALLVYLAAAHADLNLYAFILGDAEQRAWTLWV